MYEFIGPPKEQIDFEKIKDAIIATERLPNEPAELFLFRLYKVVRNGVPHTARFPDPRSTTEMNAARLLFSQEELRGVIDMKLQELQVSGYQTDKKYEDGNDFSTEDIIISRKEAAPDQYIDLSDIHTTKKTFESTNHDRPFITNSPQHRQGVAGGLFLVDEPRNEIELRYLQERVDQKEILLVGGGRSCLDLVSDKRFAPKKVTNIDPFVIPAESDLKGVDPYTYESIQIGIEDENLIQRLDKKFDEIWAHFSVPLYSRTPQEIEKSMKHMVDLLADGGTLRIFPLGVGYNLEVDKSRHSFDDSMFDALIKVIDELKQRKDLNVFFVPVAGFFGGTLFVQKIK